MTGLALLVVAVLAVIAAYWFGRNDEAERHADSTKVKVHALTVVAEARRRAPTYYEHLELRAAHGALAKLVEVARTAELMMRGTDVEHYAMDASATTGLGDELRAAIAGVDKKAT